MAVWCGRWPSNEAIIASLVRFNLAAVFLLVKLLLLHMRCIKREGHRYMVYDENAYIYPGRLTIRFYLQRPRPIPAVHIGPQMDTIAFMRTSVSTLSVAEHTARPKVARLRPIQQRP